MSEDWTDEAGWDGDFQDIEAKDLSELGELSATDLKTAMEGIQPPEQWPNLANASDEELFSLAQAGSALGAASLAAQLTGAQIPGLSALQSATGALESFQAGKLADGLGAAAGGLAPLLGATGATVAALGAAAKLSSQFSGASQASQAVAQSAPVDQAAGALKSSAPVVPTSDIEEEPAELLKPPLPTPREPEPVEPPAMPSRGPEGLQTALTVDDKHRLFRLSTLLPESKRLFVAALDGTEALNEPFEFKLTLASENPNIELKELMSQPMTVRISQTDGSERYLNGYVSTFAFEATNAGWTTYSAVLVPWLHFLSLRVNTRIFQDKSLPEILEAVFKDYAGVADVEFRLLNSYEPLDFIVQYQENDLNLISRLIERDGLTYFFEHSAQGHRLVITDDTPHAAFCQPLPLYEEIEFNSGKRVYELNSVSEVRAQRQLQPSRVSQTTFDYMQPANPLAVTLPTLAKQGDVPEIEVFDGTPHFAYASSAEGERYAKLKLERFECRAKFFEGKSDCPDLSSGFTTTLAKHPWFDASTPLLITRVHHQGRNNLDLGREHAGAEEQTAHYENRFQFQRSEVPFRPECVHLKPVIPGLQTATVTAPPGEEIWTNKHGCVKVRFHWDRLARFDASSSCWVRVAQAWAGQGWGTVAIPRAGQEVVIGFMNGDADRPLILGSVFNAQQKPPYELPAGNHMMGFKSNSTGKKYGHSEMVIHDQGGQEKINIRSQKDMTTTVLNNKHTTVSGPEHVIDVPKGEQRTTVKQDISLESTAGNITLTSAETIKLKVGQSELVMTKDGKISINGVELELVGSTRVDINNAAPVVEAEPEDPEAPLDFSLSGATGALMGGRMAMMGGAVGLGVLALLALLWAGFAEEMRKRGGFQRSMPLTDDEQREASKPLINVPPNERQPNTTGNPGLSDEERKEAASGAPGKPGTPLEPFQTPPTPGEPINHWQDGITEKPETQWVGGPPELPESGEDDGKKQSLRDQYLGDTPGKNNSRAGRIVQERMRAAGTLRDGENGPEFYASNKKWYPLKDADMSHTPTDAVVWWNTKGREYGAKSPEVREWMLNPDNYTLDHYSLNRSAGAKNGENYLPPLK